MPQLKSSRRRRHSATAVLLVALASIVLAACGGSTPSSSSSASTGTGAKAPSSTASGAVGKGRLGALRECLKRNGITLPQRKPGAGGLLGGGSIPTGASRARYEAALKKCGNDFTPRAGTLPSRLATPQAKQALAKFATCMRENGVKIGEPNTSGKGAVFNTKGVNTRTPAFAAATSKCRSDLRGVFGASPGAARGGAAPPAGAGG
jgi:hypothetical protein